MGTWGCAVRFSRYRLAVFGVVLLGSILPVGAHAQSEKEKLFDVKPFLPRFLPLPSNADVNPGTMTIAPNPSDASTFSAPQTPSTAGGLRLTIPTSPR